MDMNDSAPRNGLPEASQSPTTATIPDRPAPSKAERHRALLDKAFSIPHIIEPLLYSALSIEHYVSILRAMALGSIDFKLFCDTAVHAFNKQYDTTDHYAGAVLSQDQCDMMLKLDAYGFWCSNTCASIQGYIQFGSRTLLETLKQDVTAERRAVAQAETTKATCTVVEGMSMLDRFFEGTQLLRPEVFHARLALAYETDRAFDKEKRKVLLARIVQESAGFHDDRIASRALTHRDMVYLMLCEKWVGLVWSPDDGIWDTVWQIHACSIRQPWCEWVELICDHTDEPWHYYFSTAENRVRYRQEVVGKDRWVEKYGVQLFLDLPAYFPDDGVDGLKMWLLFAGEHAWYCFLTRRAWGFVELAAEFMRTHRVMVRIPNCNRALEQLPAWIRHAKQTYRNFEVTFGSSWPPHVKFSWDILPSYRLAIRPMA
ncbi:hypothetical protein LTR27_007514 [Elasticomyces elasticus]|nr:hypothetical protein LTR27_007514 [Elasticomyces elasticus]